MRFGLCANGSGWNKGKQAVRHLLAAIVLINLNTATIRQLDQLPGVGPVLANRIVEFREKRGGFRRIEELLAVPGISEQRWQVLRPLLEVSGPAPETP